jgi:dihydroxyacetone kinase
MVVVADDIAIPGIAQPRGVAGTLFVHKIAGCLAEQGASLPVVAEAARKVASSTVSLGISLSSCTVPGVGREDRVPAGKAELGLGIHGEPGVDLIDFDHARQVAAILSEKLFAGAGKAASYALLLNNLGSTTPLEMGVIASEILGSPLGRKIKLVVGPSLLMTSSTCTAFQRRFCRSIQSLRRRFPLPQDLSRGRARNGPPSPQSTNCRKK